MKRRSKNNSAKLPAGEEETARTSTASLAAINEQQENAPPTDEEFGYVSEGGEGNYSPKENLRVWGANGALKAEVAPIVQMLKAKQETCRANEKKELADKEAAQAAKAAEQQQQQVAKKVELRNQQL